MYPFSRALAFSGLMSCTLPYALKNVYKKSFKLIFIKVKKQGDCVKNESACVKTREGGGGAVCLGLNKKGFRKL